MKNGAVFITVISLLAYMVRCNERVCQTIAGSLSNDCL